MSERNRSATARYTAQYTRISSVFPPNPMTLRDIPEFCTLRGVRPGGLRGGLRGRLSTGLSGGFRGGLPTPLRGRLSGGLSRGLSPRLSTPLRGGFRGWLPRGLSGGLGGGLSTGLSPGLRGGLSTPPWGGLVFVACRLRSDATRRCPPRSLLGLSFHSTTWLLDHWTTSLWGGFELRAQSLGFSRFGRGLWGRWLRFSPGVRAERSCKRSDTANEVILRAERSCVFPF